MNEWRRFALGSILILGLLALAFAVALGKVEEKTSFGLGAILGVLYKVALDFSEWAFRPKPDATPDTPEGTTHRDVT